MHSSYNPIYIPESSQVLNKGLRVISLSRADIFKKFQSLKACKI